MDESFIMPTKTCERVLQDFTEKQSSTQNVRISFGHIGESSSTGCPRVNFKIQMTNKLLKCTVCKKMFATIEKLRKHTRKHSEEKSGKCKVCGVICTSGLERHVRIHSQQLNPQDLSLFEVQIREKPFKCAVCKKMFSTIKKLSKHTKKHSEEQSGKCNVCGVICTSGLARHMRRHSRFNPHVLPLLKEADICNSVASANPATQPEVQAPSLGTSNTEFLMVPECPEVTRNDQVHKCIVCGKMFFNKDEHLQNRFGMRFPKCIEFPGFREAEIDTGNSTNPRKEPNLGKSNSELPMAGDWQNFGKGVPKCIEFPKFKGAEIDTGNPTNPTKVQVPNFGTSNREHSVSVDWQNFGKNVPKGMEFPTFKETKIDAGNSAIPTDEQEPNLGTRNRELPMTGGWQNVSGTISLQKCVTCEKVFLNKDNHLVTRFGKRIPKCIVGFQALHELVQLLNSIS